MQVPQWVKPGVWGGVIGAVAIMIVGFNWWGWVLGSTAENMAKERADSAVVTVLAPICVESFMQQPEAAVKLAEFQKTSSSWQQRQLVEKGGWATVGGSKTPNAQLVSACAEQLTKAKI